MVMEALVKSGAAGIAFDKDMKRQKVNKINFSENQTQFLLKINPIILIDP